MVHFDIRSKHIKSLFNKKSEFKAWSKVNHENSRLEFAIIICDSGKSVFKA